MLTQITLAVIAAGGGENGGLLDVNPDLMIWTVITFIILVLILKKVAWKPSLTALDKRENDIKEALAQAEKAKDEAKKILEENQANLAKAEEESKKIIDQSRAYAESLREKLIKRFIQLPAWLMGRKPRRARQGRAGTTTRSHR